MINMLLILIGKNTNTQETFGYGLSSTKVSAFTGTISDKGAFYSGPIKTEDFSTAMKVFHIENYWGNYWNRIQGCVINFESGNIANYSIKMSPPYNYYPNGYKNFKGLGGSASNNHYISEILISDYGIIPLVANGSDTTYFCDVINNFSTEKNDKIICVGGRYPDYKRYVGAFSIRPDITASSLVQAKLFCG